MNLKGVIKIKLKLKKYMYKYSYILDDCKVTGFTETYDYTPITEFKEDLVFNVGGLVKSLSVECTRKYVQVDIDNEIIRSSEVSDLTFYERTYQK